MGVNEWKILTVKPDFLCHILCGNKSWEIRKTNTRHRGMVAFAASGTFKLWGTARLDAAFWMSLEELKTAKAKRCHAVSSADLQVYGQNDGAWVWAFRDVKLLQPSVAWRPKRGCIVWHNITQDLLPAVGTARRVESPDYLALRNSMEAAADESQKIKGEAAQSKGQKRKYKNK